MNIYCAVCGDELVYAVNLGGETHEDSNGILYQKDTLSYGKIKFSRNVAGASAQDQPIYGTFFYDINLTLDLPIKGNGDYKLILKFVEDSYGDRKMDVFINQVHHVVEKLNVNTNVALDTAYDRIIHFSVLNNELTWKNQVSTIKDNKIKFELTCNKRDRAQMSAFAWTKTLTINNTQPILPASENQGEVASIKNDINNILQSLKNIEGLMEKMVEKMFSSPDRMIESIIEL
jgi:hypothetical protein